MGFFALIVATAVYSVPMNRCKCTYFAYMYLHWRAIHCASYAPTALRNSCRRRLHSAFQTASHYTNSSLGPYACYHSTSTHMPPAATPAVNTLHAHTPKRRLSPANCAGSQHPSCIHADKALDLGVDALGALVLRAVADALELDVVHDRLRLRQRPAPLDLLPGVHRAPQHADRHRTRRDQVLGKRPARIAAPTQLLSMCEC